MTGRRKIRFIEPQSRPGRPFNSWITRWPLLGPITLATILEQRGYDVQVYNENVSGPLTENPAGLEDVCSADVVGISIMTPTAVRGYALAERLRQCDPRPRIVFGGVHATFRPEEALEHGDLVVRGEAESVIEAVASGELVSGIVRGEPVADLDTLPTLNHFLVRDFDKLIARARRRELYELPVMTSRGCPHACEFCTVTQMFGRRVRRQSVEKVHQDLRSYTDNGFRHLFFYDDNFTTNRDWTRRLLERMQPMKLRFNAQVRVDFHWWNRGRKQRDDAMLKAMQRAGGDVFYIGYETIDEATAAQWHKGYGGEGSLESRLLEDTRILHDNGFWIHGMFVMGPQHTEQTAGDIVRFARRSGLETMQISVLTPFPGTPLHEQMKPNLVLREFPADWDYYDGTHCVYDHGSLSVDRLQKVLLDAHRRFYGLGSWNFRRVRALLDQPVPMKDKLAILWSHARIARSTLKAWKEETAAFLQAVRSRASNVVPS